MKTYILIRSSNYYHIENISFLCKKCSAADDSVDLQLCGALCDRVTHILAGVGVVDVTVITLVPY